MPRSEVSESLKLEWRIGVAAVAFFVAFVGWAALRTRTAPTQSAPMPEAAPVRGTPLRAPVEPIRVAPATTVAAVPVAPPPAAVAPPTAPEPPQSPPADLPATPSEVPVVPAASAPATNPDPVSAAPSAPAATATAMEPPQAAVEPPVPPSPDATKDSVPTLVTIDFLSNFVPVMTQYEYDDKGDIKSEKHVDDPVPKEVRALSGHRVAIDGYMLPYDFADGKCSKFALSMIPPGCCYGCAMQPNNWVEVTMAKGKKASCADRAQIVRVGGVLVVHRVDNRESPLYTMTGETAEETK